MGTRGTLHVYVNDELKIRQYNQWDSYPTWQFKRICDFVRDEDNLSILADKLRQTRFFTKEEMKMVLEFDKYKGFKGMNKLDYDDFRKIVSAYNLINRDYGSDILWQIVALCKNIGLDDYPKYLYGLPDWAMLTDDEDNGLAGEEGNYVINLRTEPNPSIHSEDLKVHFTLSGDWHDIEREFPEDYIPTQEEIEQWEKDGDYSD